ncbi:MAG TPA: alpha-1,4-glucan--maltose-1-phosphate maltosyltransferase [Burkholderiales bacterium]|nr:alpha-1,4-glucan--maltose-1-phosphate maltosyltransferase [Burkholderiales bacterium]
MKHPGPERAVVRERSNFLADLSERSPADPTGPRFLIEDIFPSVDDGRYPVKRIAGENVDVWADIFREGHDVVAAALLWRPERDTDWRHAPMRLHSNDRWHGSFNPPAPGSYLFAIEAWTDQFATWRKEFAIRRDAGQDLSLPAREGLELLSQLRPRDRKARGVVDDHIERFAAKADVELLLDDGLAAAMEMTESRPDLTRSQAVPLLVERERARAGAWYEMVPRSQGTAPGHHGTFDDCIARVPEIAGLGFDVLYLTPIHPVGRTNRKGKNNSLNAGRNDPGSFYAIGNENGGHDAVEPQLGTLEDFRRLIAVCREHKMEIALDFAVQCSLDHPWLKEHPEWFRLRPDGTIRFAENPPKKYEDIVNPDFNGDHRIGLWDALRKVVLFWVDQGVRIFRVDNPHTKPFPFWEWLLREVRAQHPDVIFLSEAFTRPKVMKALAKLGFSQSYTYFTWRTGKDELQAYLSEITRHPERDYFRSNFFVTTPDILPIQLQSGEPWMFKSRAALAATLSSNYGIYNGFELLEHEPVPGREEYINSEKYEIKTRDWNKPGNIKDYLARLNRIRRQNGALQQTANLQFLQVDNGDVIGFLKQSVHGDNAIACAIALSAGVQTLWLHFGGHTIGGNPIRAIENLATGEQRLLEWGGARLRIDPSDDPALLFRCVA